jgi:hypothetical protein
MLERVTFDVLDQREDQPVATRIHVVLRVLRPLGTRAL